MIGLQRGTVKLAKNHEVWAQAFDKEKQLLLETFGDRIVAIEHVGSTAIPGILAKPIIDINVAISSLDYRHVEKFVIQLEKLGYHYMHKFPGRHFFSKGSEERRTHHLNLVEYGSNQWCDSIKFRDYMKFNKHTSEEYGALKEELAGQYAKCRELYTKGKEEFIQNIIQSINNEKY